MIAPTSSPSQDASNRQLTTPFAWCAQKMTSEKLIIDQAYDPHDVASHRPAPDAMRFQALKEFLLLRLEVLHASLVDETQEADPQLLVHRVLTQPGAAIGEGRPYRPRGG